MKKVLLVEPEVKQAWGHNNQYVGLLRIARWLMRDGHQIQYVRYPDRGTWVTCDEVYVTSMFTYGYREVWEAVWFYKNLFPMAKVSLGGIYATIAPDHAAQSGADEVIVGRHPEARHHPPDPRVLPYDTDFAYFFSSYGCNRACTYCATHLLFGEGIEQTPVDQVVDEIEWLIRSGFPNIWFGDDNLLYNSEGHINRICEAIIRKGLAGSGRDEWGLVRGGKASFKVPGGMAAKDFTLETAKLMRRANFTEISFAIESVSEGVRKKMGRGKNTTEEELEQALSYADEAGFDRGNTNVYFIIGLPYQTLPDMVDTLWFLLGLGVWAHPQRLTPIPNTVDWKRMGLEEWDYTDLYYKTFVSPGQEEFMGEDLDAIYRIARFFNLGRRYSGIDWLMEQGPVIDQFLSRIEGRNRQGAGEETD